MSGHIARHLRKADPIRLTFIGTISGKHGVLGWTTRAGTLLAVKKINVSGGIKGRQLELVIMDDEGKPEKAAAHANSPADDGIMFIIGPFPAASGTSIFHTTDNGLFVPVGSP